MTRCVCDDASFAARPAANERSGTGWQRVEPPQIIPKYTALLNSENYVTKRQSLKVPMHSGAAEHTRARADRWGRGRGAPVVGGAAAR